MAKLAFNYNCFHIFMLLVNNILLTIIIYNILDILSNMVGGCFCQNIIFPEGAIYLGGK